MNVIDGRRIPLEKLVEFGKREAASPSSDYRVMRQRYLACLQRFVEQVRKEVKTSTDYRDAVREFHAALAHDLKELKRELRLASIEALFSKEMAMAVGVVGGALTEPISGLTNLAITLKCVGVAPLVGAHIKLREARHQAMMGHDISWLYFSKKGRVTAV